MAEKDRIDLSKLTPQQIARLEETLSNMISSAREQGAVERLPLIPTHSSHLSG
jgi:hypothetical protein